MWDIAAAIFFFISGLFDEVDGMLARLKFQESAFGCWLETFIDYATYLLAFAGMTAGGYRRGGAVYLAVGAALLLGCLFSFFVISVQRKLAAPTRPTEYYQRYLKALDQDAGNLISRASPRPSVPVQEGSADPLHPSVCNFQPGATGVLPCGTRSECRVGSDAVPESKTIHSCQNYETEPGSNQSGASGGRAMKAVILAAGRGTRIEGVTHGLPKCLIEFDDGRTILDNQIEALWAAGIFDIAIVTGHNASCIVNHVERTFGDHLDCFTFIHNHSFATTNNIYSLWMARQLDQSAATSCA